MTDNPDEDDASSTELAAIELLLPFVQPPSAKAVEQLDALTREQPPESELAQRLDALLRLAKAAASAQAKRKESAKYTSMDYWERLIGNALAGAGWVSLAKLHTTLNHSSPKQEVVSKKNLWRIVGVLQRAGKIRSKGRGRKRLVAWKGQAPAALEPSEQIIPTPAEPSTPPSAEPLRSNLPPTVSLTFPADPKAREDDHR